MIAADIAEAARQAPAGMTRGIDGWLTGPEEAALFALGQIARGPILEIGPWLGRSTVCIAKGIASGDAKKFTTCELNPSLDDWRERDGIVYFHPGGSDGHIGGSSLADFNKGIKPVISHPDGVIGLLRKNLARAGVGHLVQIVEGDFLSPELFVGPFGLIFTDAMHGPLEINRNAPRLAELLAPGSILACHDTTPLNRGALDQHFQFSDEAQVDSLFIGVVA